MIIPTIGRVVLVRKNGNTGYPEIYEASNGDALPALVARVWNDRLLNVGGFDANGTPFALTSLVLVQDGDEIPQQGVSYAEWMPYQKAQAAKQE